MRSIIVLLAALTTLMFLTEPRMPSAGAHTVNSVEIMAQHSGKCLDNQGTTVWGTHVHQWSCDGQPWQRWTVEHRDALWHRIRNIYSNMCLDVKYASPSNGAVVWQVDCNETDAQRWTVVGSAGSWVQLRSKLGYPVAAWCLDVRWAGQGNAEVIWLWSCNGTQAQTWQIGQAYARGVMPFNGHWGSGPGDGYTDARPPVHHIVECEPSGYGVYDYSVNAPYCNDAGLSSHHGDWSVDVYAVASQNCCKNKTV